MKFYLHILSRDGNQRTCTSDSENDKQLKRLMTEGWIIQDTKEFTDIRTAHRTKQLIEQSLDQGGRMQNT